MKSKNDTKNKFEVTYMYNQNLGTNTKMVTCSIIIIASCLKFPRPVVKVLSSSTRQ